MVQFIHISKNGGETIEILLKLKKSHELAKNIENLGGKYVFAFVRNPYTRLFSWYNHFRKHLYLEELEKNSNPLNDQSISYNVIKRCSMMYPKPHRNLAIKYDFKTWAKIILTDDKYKNPYWGPCGSQYDYIFDDNDKCLVPNIFRFEKYDDEIKRLFGEIGREDLISQINRANINVYKQTVEEVYDEELKSLVYEYFKKDFENFGYDKKSFY